MKTNITNITYEHDSQKTTHGVYYMCMETTPWSYCGKEIKMIAEQNDDYEQHQ